MSVQWKTPGILGGNEVPNWKDNSGSILRRLATLNFGRQIAPDVADPHLEDKLELEMPAILCKCLRAYLDYAHKYADKDIWNVLPKYLHRCGARWRQSQTHFSTFCVRRSFVLAQTCVFRNASSSHGSISIAKKTIWAHSSSTRTFTLVRSVRAN